MNFINAFILLVTGLVAVTIIDTLGAIASRKLNFKYRYLAILSLMVYTYIGFLTSAGYGLSMGLLVNGLIGLYDGTIGLRLSIFLKANNGLDPQKNVELQSEKTVLFMITLGFFFAIVGHVLFYVTI